MAVDGNIISHVATGYGLARLYEPFERSIRRRTGKTVEDSVKAVRQTAFKAYLEDPHEAEARESGVAGAGLATITLKDVRNEKLIPRFWTASISSRLVGGVIADHHKMLATTPPRIRTQG